MKHLLSFINYTYTKKWFIKKKIFSDGAERSGIFIAISNLMEQFKLEHSIDVFQTIKKNRSIRPEFIQNEVSFYY